MLTLVLVACLGQTLTDNDRALIDAGRDWHVASIATGTNDPVLQRLAASYADWMAANCTQSIGRQGHIGFGARYAAAQVAHPECYSFGEISAESWGGVGPNRAGWEMFDVWRTSPLHWSKCNGSCSIYGYAMRRGRNGVYYACGLFGHARQQRRLP